MEICAVIIPILLILLSVFGGVESSWSIFVSENGTVEIVDPSKTLEDSISTLEELKEDVLFYLNTESNPQDGEEIYFDDSETLEASHFNPGNPTRLVIYGWQSSIDSKLCTGLRDAYLGAGDYNVILVDWSAYSSKDYIYARSKIVTVGEYVGLLIDFLVAKGGMNINDLIIIGHSLGGHIAGVAGRSAIDNAPIVIGLDPAGPLFYLVDTNARLRPTDADFVQVIHTSAGLLGFEGSLGDVDIWPNGGSRQTGCGLDLFGSCAHSRSYLYLIESIAGYDSDEKFVARACGNYWEYEGGHCASKNSTHLGGLEIDTTAKGSYFLDTNSAPGFAKGESARKK